MNKRFLLVLAACAVGLGLIFWFTSDEAGAPSSKNTQPTNHLFGEGKKGVTLTEYGDFQCAACFEYYPIIKEVIEKYKSDIYFQFRNLPLIQIHKNAFASARAAEAAGLQDKFWQMYDKLYETQDPNGASGWVASNNPLSYFNNFANELGLDINKFQQDYASPTVNNLINADISAFDKTGNAHATPTFFLNDKKIDNKADINYFSQLIEQEIAAKNKNP